MNEYKKTLLQLTTGMLTQTVRALENDKQNLAQMHIEQFVDSVAGLTESYAEKRALEILKN